MTRRNRIAIGIAALALVAMAGWWRFGRPSEPAVPTPAAASARGSAAALPPPRPAGAAAATVRDAGEARATVHVTTADAGAPIADALVRFAPRDGEVIVVKTDAAGLARADKLPEGSWTVSASAPGYLPAAAKRELAAAEAATIDLALARGGRRLTGTVTDATGGPIGGARVDAAQLGALVHPDDAIATTTTAADGTYALSVPAGRLLVAASSPDYAAQSRQVEVGPSGAVAHFALVPGGAIEGIVRDARTKQPVERAVVTARRDGGSAVVLASASSRVTTGSDGRFRVNGLRPGAYALTARARERVTGTPTMVGVGVAEQAANVELLVDRAVVVSGVVRDPAGKPVTKIEVAASNARGGTTETTDATGAFAFVGLTPGHYFLTAAGGDYVSAGATEIELADRDLGDLELRVKSGVTLTGHVEPRQVCTVSYALSEDARGPEASAGGVAPVTTSDTGEFVLGPARPVTAKLTARCASGDHGELAIDAERTLRGSAADGPRGSSDARASAGPFTIAVAGGASIAGRVVDGKGAPMAGVQVMAAADGRERSLEIINGVVTSGVQARANDRGEYLITGLDPGEYRVTALDSGRPLRSLRLVRVTLAERQHATGVDLAVDRADGVISGTVTGPDGAPLAEAWVSAHQDIHAMAHDLVASDGEAPGNHSISTSISSDDDSALANEVAPALTDAAGRFRIAQLPHGTFEVIAEAQAGALRGRAGDVHPDATLTIQAQALTTLSGTVHGDSGPAAVFDLELAGPTSTQRTFTDGHFELGRVDPGAYKLSVHGHDGNAELSLTVGAGSATTVDVPLAQNGIVIGKLVGPDGAPLAGQGVVLLADQGPSSLSVNLSGPPLVSGPDGSFRLEGPAVASELVVLVHPQPFSQRPLALQPGKTLDLGTVTVTPKPAH